MALKICWVVTAIGASIGLLLLFATMGGSESAPQEAAGAAMALAAAAIPYVFTRCIEGLTAPPRKN